MYVMIHNVGDSSPRVSPQPMESKVPTLRPYLNRCRFGSEENHHIWYKNKKRFA